MTKYRPTLIPIPAEGESLDAVEGKLLQARCEAVFAKAYPNPGSLLLKSLLGVVGLDFGYSEAASIFPVPGAAAAIPLISALATAFGTGLGAWLQARNGRKVRLKVGDIEVEARTSEELQSLLVQALEIKRDGEPKRIHER